MFKLRKFKSSFNVYNGTTKGGHPEQISYGTSSLTGAYRASRTELSMCGTYIDPPAKPQPAGQIPSKQIAQPIQTNPNINKAKNKNAAPPIPKAPTGAPPQPQGAIQPMPNSKGPPANQQLRPQVPTGVPPPPGSIQQVPPQMPTGASPNPQGAIQPTANIKGQPANQQIPQAPSGVSLNPQGAPQPTTNTGPPPNLSSKQLDAYKRVEKKRLEEQKKMEKKILEEQKKLEKKRLEEQKKSQKLALKEQAKQEKLRKEREKKEAARLKKDMKNKKQVQQRPLANPLAQSSQPQSSVQTAQPSTAPYSTNTLNSSISKSSGPPPYSEVPPPQPETNSNVQFSKPVETDTWDLVSQHRQNVIVNKHATPTQPAKGQTTMDLNFNAGAGRSDA